jgi:hypothetical protein
MRSRITPPVGRCPGRQPWDALSTGFDLGYSSPHTKTKSCEYTGT